VSRELITVEDMRAIDARAAELGVPTRALMENAGRAVADVIVARFAPCTTAVLCGPGNNGGDGWVAARRLWELGWPVWVETDTPREALKGDAADAARAYGGEVHPLGARKAALYVDALFGAGLTRPLEGAAWRLAQMLPPERTVAIDVPSGVHGDGVAIDGPAITAAITVTFVCKKLAHVLAPSKARCGEVIVADIGVPDQVLEERRLRLWENDPSLWSLPWPAADAHKHARGHCMVVSGPVARTGAARLSAHAALRAGAGLVTVLSPPDALLVNASHLTAVMVQKAAGPEEIATAARDARAVVIGPASGVSQQTRDAVIALAAQQAPLVLDADALTVFADEPDALFSRLRESDVMTPHVGEFRRLFGDLLDTSQNRLAAARAAAARARCVVLLKGPDTVIAAPDGRAIVNTNGTPFLATAGSGDVLAGIIGGLLAQGLSSFEAASAAAWLHGRAGEIVGPGLIAEDLPGALRDVLNEAAPLPLRRR